MAKVAAENKDVGKALIKLVSAKEDNRTRAFAARALSGRVKALKKAAKKDKRAITLAVPEALLKDHKLPWTVGVESIRALAAYETIASWKRLCQLTKHESFHVRRAAAKVLGQQSAKISGSLRILVEQSLRNLLDDPWETVRGEALVGLAQLLQLEAFSLISRFSREGVTARRYCARALATLDKLGKNGQALLKALNGDIDHRVRLEIIEHFGKKKGGFPIALEALDDKVISVSGTAISVLAEHDKEGISEALATRYRKDRNKTSRYELREILCTVLGERGRKKAGGTEEKVLREALTDPRNSVRIKAAEALEKITGRKPIGATLRLSYLPILRRLMCAISYIS
jgi:HEAT repeat protein